MGIHSKLKIVETESELKKLILKQVKLKNKERLRSLLYIKTNKYDTRQKLADFLGYHIRTMERWLTKYKEGGIQSMLIPNKLDRKSHIVTQEIHDGILARVNNPLTGFNSYVEAQHWVEKEFGVKIKYHWLRGYMVKEFGTKIKQPRKSHIKKDEMATEAFLKTT